MNLTTQLNQKRQHLGISQANLAEMTGLSLPTVQRFFAEEDSNVSLETTCKIAEALGFTVGIKEIADERSLVQKQARKKAKWLASVVQGTSSLEAQGLNKNSLHRIEDDFYHKLVSGSRRKLWSA